MTEEITHLREDNARLRIINNLLADRVRLLEAKLADPRINIGTSPSGYSDPHNEIGTPKLSSSHPDLNIGIQNANSSHPDLSIGAPSFSSSYPQMKIGTPNASNSHPDNNIGTPGVPSGMPEIGIGTTSPNSADVAAHNGTRTINIPIVEALLSQEMKNCKSKSLLNAAKILIQLRTDPKNSYADLHKLTGLSRSGLAKHIMALRRRGLVTRSGYQQNALTPKSINLLQDALSRSSPM